MYQGSCSGVIARKVLIRMALLQRETLTDLKNRTLNCLKWHFSTARRSIKTTAMLIEDGGICPLFRPHRGAFGSLSFPTPGNLPSNAKKLLMPVALPGGHGRTWNRPPPVGDRDLFLG